VKPGWRREAIGDVCDLMTGGTPSREEPKFFGGDIKWLVSGDIHRGEIFDCEGRITELGMRKSNAKFLPVNSVMIALNGQGKTRGTVAILRTQATCNQSLVSIFPKDPEKLLPEFLYANLHGRYQEIRQMTGDSGNDRRGLNMGLIGSILVPIPPTSEQRRIVELLDEAFEGIVKARANAEKNLQNARALFDGYLEAVFTKRGEGWQERLLGELASFRNGINFTKDSRGEEVKIVGVKDFQNDYWIPSENLDVVTIDGKLSELDVLKKGDLLAVRSNGNLALIGRCILAGEVQEKISHSGFTIRIRLLTEGLLPQYLCHFMKCTSTRKRLIDAGTGTNIKSLNQQTLSALTVPFPSMPEQRSLVARIEKISEEVQELESIYQQKLAAVDELKRSLLHQAFTRAL
jgi:type I restriction enzyme S subunit